ncbi:hypothetical protein BH20ACI3_BH20ACI3_33400 [soil metagenome]
MMNRDAHRSSGCSSPDAGFFATGSSPTVRGGRDDKHAARNARPCLRAGYCPTRSTVNLLLVLLWLGIVANLKQRIVRPLLNVVGDDADDG